MPFLPPNQQRQSTEVNQQKTTHVLNSDFTLDANFLYYLHGLYKQNKTYQSHEFYFLEFTIDICQILSQNSNSRQIISTRQTKLASSIRHNTHPSQCLLTDWGSVRRQTLVVINSGRSRRSCRQWGCRRLSWPRWLFRHWWSVYFTTPLWTRMVD